jgi:hypothetical protein
MVRIYDLGGRLVLEQGFTGILEWSADDREVPPGLYIVRVTDGSGASSAPVRLVRL